MFLELLLALLPIGVGAHAQSSTEGLVIAQDTRTRGYWVDPTTALMWAGRDNLDRDLNWRQAVKYCRDLRLALTGGWQRSKSWKASTTTAPGLWGVGISPARNRQFFTSRGTLS